MDTQGARVPQIDILLPTCNRLESLIFTLGGIAAQSLTGFRLIVADQSDRDARASAAVQSLLRIIQAHGSQVDWHWRRPVHGIAEQRHFLLEQASADTVLFIDDDVYMEPWVAERLLEKIQEQGCGFIGAFPAGLSYREDVRPEQLKVAYWEGQVEPESLEPEGPGWERWQLHRAANMFHLARAEQLSEVKLYKVAWIGACVLYDRQKLLDVGGFSFWNRLPRYHSGEEVLVQNLMMRRWGGCGMLPSGTYFSEVSSSVLNSEGSVDGHALDLLPEMLEKYP